MKTHRFIIEVKTKEKREHSEYILRMATDAIAVTGSTVRLFSKAPRGVNKTKAIPSPKPSKYKEWDRICRMYSDLSPKGREEMRPIFVKFLTKQGCTTPYLRLEKAIS